MGLPVRPGREPLVGLAEQLHDLAIRLPGRLIGALGFTVDGDTITAIDMISDRGRLRHVDLAAPGQ